MQSIYVGPAAAAKDDAPRRIPSLPPDCCEVAAKFEDAAFDFTKWDIYNDGSIPMDRFSLSRYTSLAFPLHFAAAGLLLLNTDCKTSQVYKDLKFAWERHTNMELEGSLRQLNAIMMIPSFAMWSIDRVTVIDEEKWVCNNRKAFAALQLYKCSGCRCGKQASSSSDGHCGHWIGRASGARGRWTWRAWTRTRARSRKQCQGTGGQAPAAWSSGPRLVATGTTLQLEVPLDSEDP